MKVMHVSDIHCSYSMAVKAAELASKLGVDLIVVSGDIECDDVIDALLKPGIQVLAVPGNMDDTYIARLLREKGIALDGKVVEVNGYYFAGISGLDVHTTIQMVREKVKDVDLSRLVLVSHHPPHGKVDVAWDGVHAGLYELARLVEELKPLAVLCGHIHEARGVDEWNGTIVVNPGPLAKGYYALIDLKHKKVELAEM